MEQPRVITIDELRREIKEFGYGKPPSDRKIAEGAEMLAYQFILDMEDAGELDELLSLSREEITELFNNGDFRKQR